MPPATCHMPHASSGWYMAMHATQYSRPVKRELNEWPRRLVLVLVSCFLFCLPPRLTTIQDREHLYMTHAVAAGAHKAPPPATRKNPEKSLSLPTPPLDPRGAMACAKTCCCNMLQHAVLSCAKTCCKSNTLSRRHLTCTSMSMSMSLSVSLSSPTPAPNA
jgi:hypothetical protein